MNQHRLGQVYLKQFGYQDKNKQWKVSVIKKGSEYTEQKSIKTFTAEPDIFNLPLKDPKGKLLFEHFSGAMETNYPKILSEITDAKQLSNETWEKLLAFAVNLLCKTFPYRNFVAKVLASEARDYFMNEVMYVFPEQDRKHVIETTLKLPLEKQVNPFMFPVCYYLLGRLGYKDFNYVILEDFENRGWITTDNPVVLLNDVNTETIVSEDTEMYFPLSGKYCLYMDHAKHGKAKKLIQEGGGMIVTASEELHRQIWTIIADHHNEYLIFPVEWSREKVEPF